MVLGLLGFNASATARVISETGVLGGNHRPMASEVGMGVGSDRKALSLWFGGGGGE